MPRRCAPQFAPHHTANLEALVREGYFDGLWIMRAQDNYVVQWGDPDEKKPIHNAQRTLPAEFERPLREKGLAPRTDCDKESQTKQVASSPVRGLPTVRP